MKLSILSKFYLLEISVYVFVKIRINIKMRWYIIILCFASIINLMDGANILGVFPFAAPSHFVMFGKFMRELVKRGHQVDVLGHFPLKEPIQGYNDISLAGTQQVFTNNMTMDFIKQIGGNHIITLYFMMQIGGIDVCRTTFDSDAVKTLRDSNKKYDLVITELFVTDCMLGWGYHLGVPVVAISSSESMPWTNDRFGNPNNPSYIPNAFSQLLPRMTLYERVVNTYYYLISKFMYKQFSENPSNEIAKDFFGQNMPDLEDLSYNISLFLVNTHFSLNQARPTVPNYIEVGGLHVEEPKPLNTHFQKLLTTDTKGIIYLTMGSMVMTETFKVEKIQGMFDAFAEVPYKVLWKADKEKFPKELKFPKNIHFEKWMPQSDILCDPNVKLFVTHGGLMGGEEATYCGVPRLGIPIFGDQHLNIKHLVSIGVARKVEYDEITKERFLEALTDLLNNPKYQENAKLLSDLFRDRPMSALDTAVYWTEYVIKHKGAPFLRNTGRELSWYQYHLIDVILILVSIPLVIGYLLFHIIKLFLIRKKQKNKND